MPYTLTCLLLQREYRDQHQEHHCVDYEERIALPAATVTIEVRDGVVQNVYASPDLPGGMSNLFTSFMKCKKGRFSASQIFAPKGHTETLNHRDEDMLWDLLLEHRGHHVAIVSRIFTSSHSPCVLN